MDANTKCAMVMIGSILAFLSVAIVGYIINDTEVILGGVVSLFAIFVSLVFAITYTKVKEG